MKQIETTKAVGHILCHDMTRIVPGVYKDAYFRKGHIVTEADIPMLLSMGKEWLYVWEQQPGMLHEDEGARLLGALCKGARMRAGEIKEGKLELFAESDGLLCVDPVRLERINALGELMIATRGNLLPVRAGDKLAGMRVIPLTIDEKKLAAAKTIAGDAPLLRLEPFQAKKCGIVVTGNEVASGRIDDAFSPVVANKLREFGGEILGVSLCGDVPAQILAGIRAFLEQGAELIVCTGGMSVDPDDRTPAAIRMTGAEVVSYGAPVLPGAMFLLAYLGKVPIMGLPGCVMYAGRTAFDLVLPRVMAEEPVTAEALARLGNGGLCLGCKPCHFPNCGFGRGGI